MRKTISMLVAASLLGCSTASKDISANYISPVTYQSYDCQQMAAEAARLQAKVTQIGGRLDEAAANDKAITGAGIILFWPALFALGGTKQQEAEYANLRGQADALSQASIEKKCAIPTAAPAPAPVTSPAQVTSASDVPVVSK